MNLRQFTAGLEARAAELRTGVSLIEAAAVDEFETQLRTVAATAEERAALRRMTLQLAASGVTEDDLEPMVREYHTQFARTVYELYQIQRRLTGIMERLGWDGKTGGSTETEVGR